MWDSSVCEPRQLSSPTRIEKVEIRERERRTERERQRDREREREGVNFITAFFIINSGW